MWEHATAFLLAMFITTTSSNKIEEAEEEDEITDQEVEAFLTSVLFVTIFTIFMFTIFQRTRNNNNNENNPNSNAMNANNATLMQMQRQQALYRHAQMEQQMQFQQGWNGGREEEEPGSIPSPPPDSKHGLLLDGVLPFRHGDAKNWNLELKQQNHKHDVITATLGGTPLSRGCNVVLTIKESDLINEYEKNNGDKAYPRDIPTKESLKSICDALTTLGSEYNLFVILDLEREPTSSNEQKVKESLKSVPEEVLPRHRIVAANSVTGRVAFVRQLRPELVVDYDKEVRTLLTRFGFKVHIYGDGTGGFGELCQLVI